MEKITSITRIKETGCSGVLAYRYYIDGNMLWFNLHDICEFFNIYSERFVNTFFDNLLDCNKTLFLDDNNPKGVYERTMFVDKVAINKLEENQRIRHSSLNVDIRDLEQEEYLVIEDDKNNYEFKQLVQNIKNELYGAERNDLNKHVLELLHTRQVKELVEDKEYDQGLEEEVLSYKQWLLEEYDPECSVYMMCKKVRECNENEYVYFDKFIGPTMDEALEILYKAGLEE